MLKIQVISHSHSYCGLIGSGGKKSFGSSKAGLTFVSSVWIRQILPLVYTLTGGASLLEAKHPGYFLAICLP